MYMCVCVCDERERETERERERERGFWCSHERTSKGPLVCVATYIERSLKVDASPSDRSKFKEGGEQM